MGRKERTRYHGALLIALQSPNKINLTHYCRTAKNVPAKDKTADGFDGWFQDFKDILRKCEDQQGYDWESS